MKRIVFLEKPEGFTKQKDIVSVFCEYKGEILSLLRVPTNGQGNKRGGPAGKYEKEKDDNFDAAAKRELKEETGIDLDNVDVEMKFCRTYYARYPEQFDFEYHKYHIIFNERPDIKIDEKEHTDYIWKTPENTLGLELVLGEDEVIQHHYGIK